jgi:glycosyltransferase involved in cell wall biosynthesis
VWKANRMTLPRISVVTPSFNQGDFLEECIHSVLSQNYPDLEYIIIDGGSTDNSVEIIRKYERHLAYWVSATDKGQSHALNKGFARATGEVMAYINSDDKYFSWAFKTVGGLFREFPSVEWLTSIEYLCWNANGDPIPGWHVPGFRKSDFFEGKTLGNSMSFLGWIQQESTFWRRSLWDKSGCSISMELHYAMDFDLWARFFEHSYLYGVALPLGGNRFQPAQKTASGLAKYYDEASRVLATYRERGGALLNDKTLKVIRYNFHTAVWDLEG